MSDSLRGPAGAGLERSCGPTRSDWVRTRALSDGVDVLQAWFSGHGFDTHRHDTYAIGLTDVGVQVFDYRGATEISTPGKVVVLHPDEMHDGRAGTAAGFGYRIVYVAPALIGEAARAICGRPCALPFVRDAVASNGRLEAAIARAFFHAPEPQAIDDLILRMTGALLDADPSCRGRAGSIRIQSVAMTRTRELLDAETTRIVPSSELEAITGLSRYEIARQFRAAFGTSPYRYSLMRRLDRARAHLRGRRPLADVALRAGFADQAHLTRMFKAAFGITPSRYRQLEQHGNMGQASPVSGVSGSVCGRRH